MMIIAKFTLSVKSRTVKYLVVKSTDSIPGTGRTGTYVENGRVGEALRGAHLLDRLCCTFWLRRRVCRSYEWRI